MQNMIVSGLIPKDIISSPYYWNYQVKKILKLQNCLKIFRSTVLEEYKIYVLRSLCDLPARSILLYINNHGGYYACNMCPTVGKIIDGVVKYPSTSESKIERSEKEYHETIIPLLTENILMQCKDVTVAGFQNITPFSQLKFGSQLFNPRIFSVNDVMHTVFEGHFVTLFNIWETKKTSFSKNVDFVWLKQQLPSWFKRQPRSFVKKRKYFKAKEWMIFFFFFFQIIEHLFEKTEYIFISSMIKAIYTLCFPCTLETIAKCERVLYLYHIWFKKYYGEQYCTLKTHFLLHLADTVR